MPQIISVQAKQILDCAGFPTIEIHVFSDSGAVGSAIVPSDNSNLPFSLIELRDNDLGRFLGKGVIKAVNNVNSILNEELKGLFIDDQHTLDASMLALDGTENMANLGANVIYGVSIATARCAALSFNIPFYRYLGGLNSTVLPTPLMNLICRSEGANCKLDMHEFHILPVGVDSYSESLRMGVEIFQSLNIILKNKGFLFSLSANGNLAPSLESDEQAFDLILSAIEKSGYKPGVDVFLAINASSSDFYNPITDRYHLNALNSDLTSHELINYYKSLIDRYPIISIEDGLDIEDWANWPEFNATLGTKLLISGGKLFGSNSNLIEKGVCLNAANSIVIKPNQLGTITEIMNIIRFADTNSLTTILSCSNNETDDVFIAELAVALNIGILKAGSPNKLDSISKYNELLRIEEALGNSASFLGRGLKFL